MIQPPDYSCYNLPGLPLKCSGVDDAGSDQVCPAIQSTIDRAQRSPSWFCTK